MEKLSKPQIVEFLRESNAIEGVFDEYSLDQAYFAWRYLMSEDKMSTSVVLKTHKILMLNKKDLMPDQIGYFRRVPVWIGRREGMDWSGIKFAIGEWCDAMNEEIIGGSDKERISKELHVEYENIHPFVDGNGRSGRMLMAWWRLKNGLPLLIIHEGKEQMEYYKWFKDLI